MGKLDLQAMQTWLPGLGEKLLIAGPCSAESEQKMLSTALGIKEKTNCNVFRAGIWKPRTRPNMFEGVGAIGLEWLKTVKQTTGMYTATEVANAQHVEACLESGVDILWIGARTTVNPFQVQEIADALKGTNIPVLVKNPIHADVQLWLGALERLNKTGLTKLGAIFRGVHLANSAPFRNAPAWQMAIELRTLLQVPIICDPSHICGNTELIPYIAQKSIDLDMDGLMIETHITPKLALSDAQQQVTPAELSGILDGLVYRKQKSEDVILTNKLDDMREEINKVDDVILQMLAERLKITKKIGEYKRDNDITILQMNRWKEMLSHRTLFGELMGLDKDFINQLYFLIHQDSIREQALIMENKNAGNFIH